MIIGQRRDGIQRCLRISLPGTRFSSTTARRMPRSMASSVMGRCNFLQISLAKNTIQMQGNIVSDLNQGLAQIFSVHSINDFPPYHCNKPFSRQLQLIQLSINAVLVQQLLMGSAFPNPAVMHYDNPVTMLNGGQPVSYHYAGSPAHQLCHRVLNPLLRFGIDIRRRLVQNQYRGEIGRASCRERV